MFQPSDASQTKKESPSNAFQANQLSDHPLSAILWKLFFGGLLVDVISFVGLFLVGALSVTLRLSSYRSFLLGLIPITLDGLIVAGTIVLIGKIFFGRSGPLDNKRWERYIMGQIPGFLLAAILTFAVKFWASDREDVFSNGSVFLIFVGAAIGGFGLGVFSVFTHNAKDIASVRQAKAASNVSQSKTDLSIEQVVLPDEIPTKKIGLSTKTAPGTPISALDSAEKESGSATASAVAGSKSSPKVAKLKGWQILLLSLLVIGAVFVIYWVKNSVSGSSSAAFPSPQSASAGEQNGDHPIKPPAGCRLWSEIHASDAGRKVCAYGVVEATYLGGEITYIVFTTDDKSAFRLINLEGKDYSNLRGRCVIAEGEVKTFGEVSYIEVDGKLNLCE